MVCMVKFQFPLSNANARSHAHTCSYITIQHFKQFIKRYFSLRFFPLWLPYKWFLLEGNDILAQTRNTVASSLGKILDVYVLNYSCVYWIFMGFKTPFHFCRKYYFIFFFFCIITRDVYLKLSFFYKSSQVSFFHSFFGIFVIDVCENLW